jgi:hypothetical protein
MTRPDMSTFGRERFESMGKVWLLAPGMNAASDALDAFLADAGLHPAALSRARAVLHDEDIGSVELLRCCWGPRIKGKLSIGAANALEHALGIEPRISEAMETTAVFSSSIAAAANVVVLVVEVLMGSQQERLWLSLSPEEYTTLPVSGVMRQIALQAYDCFRKHVLIEALTIDGFRLDLGRSLAAQGVLQGTVLCANATPGNPISQAAVTGAAHAPAGSAAGSASHAARVAEHAARDDLPLNPQRTFVCHGDCLPGIHSILHGKSTAQVALVPGYLAGTGTRVLSNGCWYDVAGTAKSLVPACKGVLTSAQERQYGMCDPCAGIRSNGAIKSRLQYQRSHGRLMETNALSLLQSTPQSSYVNHTFEPFFELMRDARLMRREIDANRSALEMAMEIQRARESALLAQLQTGNSARSAALASQRALRKASSRQSGQLERLRQQVRVYAIEVPRELC